MNVPTTELYLLGDLWEVALDYVPFIAIGEAERTARDAGFHLPTPALVDAIWAAADAKVLPMPRRHDGTPRTMASREVYADQAALIAKAFEGTSPYALRAGHFKDVVLPEGPGGRLGLYGWHVEDELAREWAKNFGISVHKPVENVPGFVVQPLFTGHSPTWVDYSQGCRMVRRVL